MNLVVGPVFPDPTDERQRPHVCQTGLLESCDERVFRDICFKDRSVVSKFLCPVGLEWSVKLDQKKPGNRLVVRIGFPEGARRRAAGSGLNQFIAEPHRLVLSADDIRAHKPANKKSRKHGSAFPDKHDDTVIAVGRLDKRRSQGLAGV